MITIIDYNAGNLTSVKLAFAALGIDALVTADPETVRNAERAVFPGVGAAGAAMENLAELELLEPLRDIADRDVPFLGICVGTQILLEHSDEDGGVDTIGLINGQVRRFTAGVDNCKIPQMGWNQVNPVVTHPLFADIADGSEFYFVHSYYPVPERDCDRAAETDYAGICFASILARDNLFCTQFHPEKSGRIGLQLLKNFNGWNP